MHLDYAGWLSMQIRCPRPSGSKHHTSRRACAPAAAGPGHGQKSRHHHQPQNVPPPLQPARPVAGTGICAQLLDSAAAARAPAGAGVTRLALQEAAAAALMASSPWSRMCSAWLGLVCSELEADALAAVQALGERAGACGPLACMLLLNSFCSHGLLPAGLLARPTCRHAFQLGHGRWVHAGCAGR